MHSHSYNAYDGEDCFEGCILSQGWVFFHYKGKRFVAVTGSDFPNKNNFCKYVYISYQLLCVICKALEIEINQSTPNWNHKQNKKYKLCLYQV